MPYQNLAQNWITVPSQLCGHNTSLLVGLCSERSQDEEGYFCSSAFFLRLGHSSCIPALIEFPYAATLASKQASQSFSFPFFCPAASDREALLSSCRCRKDSSCSEWAWFTLDIFPRSDQKVARPFVSYGQYWVVSVLNE